MKKIDLGQTVQIRANIGVVAGIAVLAEVVMSSTARLLSALLLLAVLPACIAIPVGLGGEDPFPDEQLTFIEIGNSTKEDIAAAMPQPMQFLDGNTWLYARRRQEAQFLAIEIDGTETTYGDFDLRYLVIKFDDSGVVAGYETSSWENFVGCNQSGVCYAALSTHMLVAPEEEDQTAKQFVQPADRCGVYVYGRGLNSVAKTLDVAPIELDDRRIGGIFDNEHFIFEQTSPGLHRLNAEFVGQSPIELTCAAGSSVFVEVQKRRCGLFGDCGRFEVEVAQRDVPEGQQAITDRDWIVTASESTE